MLSQQPWIKPSDGLEFELTQAQEQGLEITEEIRQLVQRAIDAQGSDKQALALKAHAAIARLPMQEGYPYQEPSDLQEIRALRAGDDRPMPIDQANLYDRIYGAWLGRCAGCLLGQPVEGWKRERIDGLLKETGNYPLTRYISSDIAQSIRQKYGVTDQGSVYGSDKINWINNVAWMPEDDDTNYTVIGLKLIETYGFDYTPEDVGECWLQNLPYLHVCTAERVAYRNLVAGLMPPESATHANSYREWIGAQIRGDMFGYVAPGMPHVAAELAWRDASISHIKNGIYGEMWIAAMLSAAASTQDMEQIIRTGLRQLPQNSRLVERVEQVLSWKAQGMNWEQAIEQIHADFDEHNGHDWCHTLSNAMIVAAGLLFGEMDLGRTLAITIHAAFDTDCNAATAGSVLGMALGAKQLPETWVAPLNDTLKSGVDGFGVVKISDLAKRSALLAAQAIDRWHK